MTNETPYAYYFRPYRSRVFFILDLHSEWLSPSPDFWRTLGEVIPGYYSGKTARWFIVSMCSRFGLDGRVWIAKYQRQLLAILTKHIEPNCVRQFAIDIGIDQKFV